jgi:hypothetical protein
VAEEGDFVSRRNLSGILIPLIMRNDTRSLGEARSRMAINAGFIPAARAATLAPTPSVGSHALLPSPATLLLRPTSPVPLEHRVSRLATPTRASPQSGLLLASVRPSAPDYWGQPRNLPLRRQQAHPRCSASEFSPIWQPPRRCVPAQTAQPPLSSFLPSTSLPHLHAGHGGDSPATPEGPTRQMP